MSVPYVVPLSPTLPQQLSVSLGGTIYQITARWNVFLASWVMDVADQNGNAIVCGVPLVTGANLLAQYGYLGIGAGGALIVQSDNDPDLVPSIDTLGETGRLYFVSP